MDCPMSALCGVERLYQASDESDDMNSGWSLWCQSQSVLTPHRRCSLPRRCLADWRTSPLSGSDTLLQHRHFIGVFNIHTHTICHECRATAQQQQWLQLKIHEKINTTSLQASIMKCCYTSKIKSVYSSLQYNWCYGVPTASQDHIVLPTTRQRWILSQARQAGRWLLIQWDDIQLVTRPGTEQMHWLSQRPLDK